MEALNFDKGLYRTGGRRIDLFCRMMPAINFYIRAFAIVYFGSRVAKRGGYSTERWQADSLGILRALEKAGIKVEISGMENLTSFDGPCVFVSNHMSTLETFVFPAIIVPFKNVTFVIKQNLLAYPVFGHIMKASGPIAISRENPRKDLETVLKGGAEKLGKGISIVVFPQTTRSIVFEPEKFNSIGIKLARKAGVPIVPVALKSDAWGNGRFIKDFGKIDPSKRVYISFGEPMRVAGKGAEEHERVVSFIQEKLRMWGLQSCE